MSLWNYLEYNLPNMSADSGFCYKLITCPLVGLLTIASSQRQYTDTIAGTSILKYVKIIVCIV